ncbi:MAG TPA: winged helix-turn-helix domain-containing protein [Thermoanaerobaculia bacterium]|nr:winged helix-turn-helix domain-containing protein [Thermoanaerobaculia bacterium]
MSEVSPRAAAKAAPGRLWFDDFELLLDTCELFRGGRPVRLQQRPARLLALLARHAGEAVSRDEIHQQVWGDRAFVDLEQALNFSVRQLRLALGDSAAEPRFVATVPRYGYRFVAPVQTAAPGATPIAAPGAADAVAAGVEVSAVAPAPAGLRRRAVNRRLVTAAAALVAVAISGAWLAGRRQVGDAGTSRAVSLGPGPGLGMGMGANTRAITGRPPGIVPDGASGQPPSGVPHAAYQAYLDGFFLMHSSHPQDRLAALVALERATASPPGFAAAFGALALARLDINLPAAQVVPGVEEAARRALAIDPDSVEAHIALGWLALGFQYDLPRAGRELARALAAEPNSGDAQLGYAFYLAAAGRHDEAIAAAERAQGLDLMSPVVKGDLSWFYYLARRYDQAIEEARHALLTDPRDIQALLYWSLSAQMQHDIATALAQAQAFAAADADLSGQPRPPRFATLADFWRWRLASLTAKNLQAEISPGYFAMAHLGLGDRSRALELLEQACDRHFCAQLPLVVHDPRFDPLRHHPRFARLLRCAGQATG